MHWINSYYKKRETQRLEKQLPEALTLMISSLGAGFTLEQALEVLSREAQNPMQKYVDQVLKHLRLGRSLEEALGWWSMQVESEDLELTVAAILIHRQLGGDLAEVLARLGNTIRERQQLRNSLRALTSQGRLTGTIIAILPLALLGTMAGVVPGHVASLFSTVLGNMLMGIAAIFELTGFYFMRKICRVKY